jgi:hypothetical protein
VGMHAVRLHPKRVEYPRRTALPHIFLALVGVVAEVLLSSARLVPDRLRTPHQQECKYNYWRNSSHAGPPSTIVCSSAFSKSVVPCIPDAAIRAPTSRNRQSIAFYLWLGSFPTRRSFERLIDPVPMLIGKKSHPDDIGYALDLRSGRCREWPLIERDGEHHD